MLARWVVNQLRLLRFGGRKVSRKKNKTALAAFFGFFWAVISGLNQRLASVFFALQGLKVEDDDPCGGTSARLQGQFFGTVYSEETMGSQAQLNLAILASSEEVTQSKKKVACPKTTGHRGS